MSLFTSRRLNRYDDEANNPAYMENEPFHVLPPERFTTGNSSQSDSSTYGSHRTAGDGSGKCDLLSMQHVMNMTESLQKEQEDREARDKVDKASEAERMRQVRNAQWEAVKKRMSQRAIPLYTVRAYDSEDDEEEVELKSVHTALNALVPSMTEERATRRGEFQAAETMPERFCHFVYNWLMYFVYAFSASALPGMDASKGADSREYFDRRVR